MEPREVILSALRNADPRLIPGLCAVGAAERVLEDYDLGIRGPYTNPTFSDPFEPVKITESPASGPKRPVREKIRIGFSDVYIIDEPYDSESAADGTQLSSGISIVVDGDASTVEVHSYDGPTSGQAADLIRMFSKYL